VRRCSCCASPFVEVIDTVLEEMEQGRASGVTVEAITKMLQSEYDFPFSSAPVGQHLRRHRSDVWARVREL